MQNSSRHRLNGLLRNKRKMAFAVNARKAIFFLDCIYFNTII